MKTIFKFKCLRCGHIWWPKTPDKPRVCPKCKSPYYDRPRKKKGVINER